MKKILITGENSYVGNSFEKWLRNTTDKYTIDKISVRDDSWKAKDFSDYDVVLHVAGLAHQKETKENKHLYYRVNRDLAYEVAVKAKNAGVGQFIFLSSMSVYGLEQGVINENTQMHPTTNYGKSKLQAERMIEELAKSTFIVAIIRPPMIYGKGCKGNYIRLAQIARKTPLFPNIKNKRSMIHIDNLCEFLKLIIDDGNGGRFYPQNEEYVCTTDLVEMIAELHNNKIMMTKLFNPIIKVFDTEIVTKVFGDLVYEISLSKYDEYEPITLEESIKRTEI